MPNATATALAAALLATAAAAQTVWTVPQGQALDPYIAMASPGDVLLLDGYHPEFVLDKGLSIIGRGTYLYTPQSGTSISGFNQITVNVPPGQQATLQGFALNIWSATGTGTNGIIVYGGKVTIADVDSNSGISVSGETILQRVRITSGGLGISGTCLASDVTVKGRNLATTFTSVLTPSPAISVGGASTRFIGSRITATGGTGGSVSTYPFLFASREGLDVLSGQVFLTDSVLQGGAGGAPVLGGVAVASPGNVALARTTLVDGAGAQTTSSGYQFVPTMVGLVAGAPPTRGRPFQATATAGSSLSLLAIVGGHDRTLNTLPPFVEPLLGNPSQLVALALAAPAPGAQVPVVVAVPQMASLLGTAVWLQALQLDGATIRASAVVGGATR